MRRLRSCCIGLVVAVIGCSGPKSQRVSAPGSASNIVRGGDRVAYLLDVGTGAGATGALHVAGTMPGSDATVAGDVSAGGYMLSPDGKALFFARLNADHADASLSWYDVDKGGAPRVLFAHGLKTALNNPDDMSMGVHAETLANQLFSFSPSGKFLLAGVLAPGVANSPDLHVIETATGNDVFQRGNGTYDYVQLVLPDDTLLFQDAPGGNDGPAGPTALLQLFWVRLGATTASPATIDARVATFIPTRDNQHVIYQRTDRQLFTWDATARPASGTALATDAVSFAAGTTRVVYSTGDGAIHVLGVDGSRQLDLTSAGADVNSPLYLSGDDRDVYYFQSAEPQSSRGTLMHVAATGGTLAKIDAHVGLYDLQILPGAILYLRNVDAQGFVGDAVKATREGREAVALGTGVPAAPPGLVVPQSSVPGGLIVANAAGDWLAPHLTGARTNKLQRLIDGNFPTLGALALATATGGGETLVEASARAGGYMLADDNQTLVYLGGLTLNLSVDNYVGQLAWVPTATSAKTKTPVVIALDAVSELSTVVKRSLFAVSNGKSTGVYFVTY